MGTYLSKPITDKESEDSANGWLSCGSSSMQGWRESQEVNLWDFSTVVSGIPRLAARTPSVPIQPRRREFQILIPLCTERDYNHLWVIWWEGECGCPSTLLLYGIPRPRYVNAMDAETTRLVFDRICGVCVYIMYLYGFLFL